VTTSERLLDLIDLAVTGTESIGDVEIYAERHEQVRAVANRRGQVQAGRAVLATATVRAWAEGGCALVSTEDVSAAGVAEAVRAATRLAARFPGEVPVLPRPDGTPAPVADLDPPSPIDVAELADRLRRAVWAGPGSAAVRDVRAVRGRRSTAVASSTGIRAAGASAGTTVSAYVFGDSPVEPADALVSEFGRDGEQALVDRLTGQIVALERILRFGRDGSTPVAGPVHAGRPLLLRPLAVARLLQQWVERFLVGGSAARWSVGDEVADPSVTLVEDPLARCSPLAAVHDGEGLWTRPVTLLERGRVLQLLHSSATAQAAGVAPNACAVRHRAGGPRPGYRGLRLGLADPARTLLADPDAFEVDDVLVPPPGPARTAGAPILLIGRSAPGQPGAAVVPLGLPLADLLADVAAIGSDPTWFPNGVEGRSVLIRPGERHPG